MKESNEKIISILERELEVLESETEDTLQKSELYKLSYIMPYIFHIFDYGKESTFGHYRIVSRTPATADKSENLKRGKTDKMFG